MTCNDDFSGGTGTELAGFGLTGHPTDLSWAMMRQIEDGLSGLFGEDWTEKR